MARVLLNIGIMIALNTSKGIAIVTTALFSASVLWIAGVRHINASLETRLEHERLKSEELLSEKLKLEKDLLKTKNQLFTLQDRNLALENAVTNAKAKLEIREAEFKRTQNEMRSLVYLRSQRNQIQNDLKSELEATKADYFELEAKNRELRNEVAGLQERNVLLAGDLSKSMLAVLDQSQVNAVKGNAEKLTVRAGRTKKLVAIFEVPDDLKSLTFRIFDPNGNLLTQEDGLVASKSTSQENGYVASANTGVRNHALQKVEMTFIPHGKLKSGVYTVEISNANLYVGSLKAKLQ